jgi:hypothetical protein
MHPPPGKITGGSDNVRIGGRTAGVTLGNDAAGTAACNALSAGRMDDGSTTQSKGWDCGIESCRQLLNQGTGTYRSEQKVLSQAEIDGSIKTKSGTYEGATDAEERDRILNGQGVPSHLQDQNMATIQQAVAEGRGVISSNDYGRLHGHAPTQASHAMVVTAIEYGPDGKPYVVTANDTAAPGGCGHRFLAGAEFEPSLNPGKKINVTDKPIW